MDGRGAFGYFGAMTASPHHHHPAARALTAALVALAAVACVYPGLMLGREIPISNEGFALSDLLDVNVPLRVWAAHSLAHGHLPLWYPGCTGGMPLAAIPEAVPYDPPSALFYMMLPPGPATAYTIVLHLVLAGVGAAMLTRHWGAKPAGQALAALLLSVGLHLPAHMRQLNVLQAEAWIPWAWLFWDRLLLGPSRRNAAGLGLSLGLLGLAGHPEILHHTLVVLGFWTLIRLAGARARWRDRHFWTARAATFAGAALLATAVALPHMGPIGEMYLHIDRSQTEKLAPSPAALAMLARPTILGDPLRPPSASNPFFQSIAWEQMLYMGLLPLGLAACALLARRRRRLVWELAALAAISLLLVYGARWGATRWIGRLIPLESASRFPHRYLWCCNMVLVAWAAMGMDALLELVLLRFKFLLMAALLAISLADLAWFTRRLNPTGDGSPWLDRPESLDWLEQAGASPRAFGERLATYGNLRVLKEAFDIKPAWNANPPVDTETHRLFVGDHPSLWGWPVTRGYVGMEPSWVGSVMGNQSQPGLLLYLDADWNKPLQESAARVESFVAWSGFYGGRWLASPIGLASPNLRPVRLIPGRYFDCCLYENRAWPGAAWIAHEVRAYATVYDMLADMVERSPDTRTVRMMRAEVPRAWPHGTQPAAIAERILSCDTPDPEHIVVDCALVRPGFLVLNGNYHPRWRVRVDGGPGQPALRVNVCQMAVRLDPGQHRVEFEYAGSFEKICLAIGLLGLIAALAGLVPSRRAPRPSQPFDI